jgi:RNA polymerase sigma-70 factor, ECF subfamily
VSRPRGAPEPSPGNDDELEQGLIIASQMGDTEAFGKLYQKYRGGVYAVCLQILKEPADAEDAVQDTFLRAFLSLPSFKTGKPLRPWLASTAHRRSIDIFRHRNLDRNLQSAQAQRTLLSETVDPFNDDTFEEMLRAQNMAKLQRALAMLPSRQRRALMLFAVDGWSYADIASGEGASFGAINLLLVRARKKLREAWESLGAILVAPWQALIERLQRDTANMPAGGWLSAAAPAIIAAGLALIMATQPQSPGPARGGAAGGKAGDSQNVRTVTLAQPANPPGPNRSRKPENKAPAAALIPGIPEITTGEQEPTPENSIITSIEPSPSYEEDRTVFATAFCVDKCGLFVTRDGGANWEWQPAQSLLPKSTLLIPPGYSKDGIFAMGFAGLQHSLDGGRTFTTVSPVTGIAAISPGFKAGDRRIIIAETPPLLFEYLVDLHETRPLRLGVPDGSQYTAMSLNPRFPSDPTILLVKTQLQPTVQAQYRDGHFSEAIGSYESTFQHCVSAEGECQDVSVKETPLQTRFSPAFSQGTTVYSLLSSNRLITSVDMMQTYEDIRLRLAEDVWVSGLAVLPGAGSPRILLPASHSGLGDDVYYSADRGVTWEARHIPLTNFIGGAFSVAATSTGRLFASGFHHGIACSEDEWYSWKARCTPEP